MTQVELDKIVEVTIGEYNVALMNEHGAWEEFSPFDKGVLDLYERAMRCLHNGSLDPKKLLELDEFFDRTVRDFVDKLTFGKDQIGYRVTSEQLFGEIKSIRPEYIPYVAAKFILLWAVERKIRLIREEQLDMKKKYEAIRISGIK